MPRRNKSKHNGKARKYHDRPFAKLEQILRSKHSTKGWSKEAP